MEYEKSTKDITYLWFCLKCQNYHDSPHCPYDKTDPRILPGTIAIYNEEDDYYYSLR